MSKYLNILAFIIAAVLYLPSLQYDFTYDDFWQIHRNPAITETGGDVLHQAVSILTTPTRPGNLYRPLPSLTYLLQWRLFGANAAAFHAFNIALYLILALLVSALYFRLSTNPIIAICALLIFVAHPLHIETVASVVGRAELLALIFGLASMLQCLNFAKQKNTFRLVGGLVFFAFAILSKESGYAFMGLIPMVLFYQQTAKRELLVVTGTLLCTALVLICIRFLVLGAALTSSEALMGETFENPLAGLPFTERFIPALVIFGRYLLHLCFPFFLSADYSLPLETLRTRTFSMEGLAHLLVVMIFFVLLLRLRKSGTGLLAWWIPISLILTSNLLFPAGTLMGDRLALTASAGFCLLMAELLSKTLARHAVLMLAVIGLLFFYQTSLRVPVWRNNLSLFRSMTLDNSESPKAFFNYGIELATNSEDLEAELSLRRALELAPEHLPTMKALTDLLIRKHELGRAKYFLQKILKLEPQNQKVLNQLKLLDPNPTLKALSDAH